MTGDTAVLRVLFEVITVNSFGFLMSWGNMTNSVGGRGMYITVHRACDRTQGLLVFMVNTFAVLETLGFSL